MSAEGRDRPSMQSTPQSGPQGSQQGSQQGPPASASQGAAESKMGPCAELQDWLLDRSPTELRELLERARQAGREDDLASPPVPSGELHLAQRWLNHAESCSECATELRWIETLAEKVEGELHRRVAPGRDLWPQIAEHLEGPIEGRAGFSIESPAATRLGPRRAAVSRPLRTGITRWAALAATLVIGTLLGLYLAERGNPRSVPTAGSQVLPAASGVEVELELLRQSRRQEQASRSLRELTASYDLLRELLVKSLDDPEGGMSEEISELLRRELTAIDSSILELREAIEQEPDNQLLHQLLLASYDQQLQLLRRAQKLSYRL